MAMQTKALLYSLIILIQPYNQKEIKLENP